MPRGLDAIAPVTLRHVPRPPSDKAGWRAWCRKERRALSPMVRRQHAEAVAGALVKLASEEALATVGLYDPIGAEPDTRPLANALLAAGVALAYPRLCEDQSLVMVRCLGPSALRPRPRMRLMEPEGPAMNLQSLDALVMPALCVDGALRRLGQGGGSYDRLLAQLPERTLTIALVPQALCVPWTGVQAHDGAADLVCTERGLFRGLP